MFRKIFGEVDMPKNRKNGSNVSNTRDESKIVYNVRYGGKTFQFVIDGSREITVSKVEDSVLNAANGELSDASVGECRDAVVGELIKSGRYVRDDRSKLSDQVSLHEMIAYATKNGYSKDDARLFFAEKKNKLYTPGGWQRAFRNVVKGTSVGKAEKKDTSDGRTFFFESEFTGDSTSSATGASDIVKDYIASRTGKKPGEDGKEDADRKEDADVVKAANTVTSVTGTKNNAVTSVTSTTEGASDTDTNTQEFVKPGQPEGGLDAVKAYVALFPFVDAIVESVNHNKLAETFYGAGQKTKWAGVDNWQESCKRYCEAYENRKQQKDPFIVGSADIKSGKPEGGQDGLIAVKSFVITFPFDSDIANLVDHNKLAENFYRAGNSIRWKGIDNWQETFISFCKGYEDRELGRIPVVAAPKTSKDSKSKSKNWIALTAAGAALVVALGGVVLADGCADTSDKKTQAIIDALEKDNEGLKQDNQLKADIIADLENEKTTLEGEKAALQATVNAYEQRIADYEKQIADLEKQIDEAAKNNTISAEEFKKLEAQYNNLLAVYNTVKSERDDFEKKYKSADAKHKNAMKALATETKRANDLAKQVASKDTTIAEKDKIIKDKDATIDSLNKTIKSQNSTISTLRSEIADNNDEISALEDEIASKDAKIASLQEQLKNAQGSDKAALLAQIAELTTANEDLTAKVIALGAQNNTLSSYVSELTKANSGLKSAVKNLENTILGLEEENSALEEENANLTTENIALKNVISIIHDEKQDLEEENADLRAELDEAIQDYNHIKKLYDDLLASGNITSDEYEKELKAAKDALAKQIAENSALQAENEEQAKDIENLESVIQVLTNKNEANQVVISDLLSSIEEKNGEIANKDAVIEELEAKLVQALATLSEQGIVNESLKEEIEALREALKNADNVTNTPNGDIVVNGTTTPNVGNVNDSSSETDKTDGVPGGYVPGANGSSTGNSNDVSSGTGSENNGGRPSTGESSSARD